MSNPFGIQVEKSSDKKAIQTLFYFIREFKFNPFDEEYEIKDKEGKLIYKITKKGIPMPLYNTLLEEMNAHYKREEAEMKRARRK